MKKVVINNCYGGFGLSITGTKAYYARKGIECYAFENRLIKCKNQYVLLDSDNEGSAFFVSFFSVKNPNEMGKDACNFGLTPRPEDRDDSDLVAVVEELGEKSWGDCAKLKIVEIPDDVKWHIEEYDGIEHVAEDHRIWS